MEAAGRECEIEQDILQDEERRIAMDMMLVDIKK